jgi:hypothetical protein
MGAEATPAATTGALLLLLSSLVATSSAQQQQLPFSILPANRAAPAARWPGTTTWGIAVGKEGDVYHAFVNTVANNCSLASWTPNSKIVRATSSSALGPFEPQETVLEAFHGNPQLTRAPDGTWLLFTVGIGSLRAEQLHECPGPGHSGPRPPQPHVNTVNMTVLHSAKSLLGPWTRVPGTDGAESILPGLTNPTAHIMPNGSVVVLGIPQGCCSCAPGGCLHAATAPHWSGPYTLERTRGIIPFEATSITDWVFEDPFVFWDGAARRWHLLMHQYNASDSGHQRLDGGYAVSEGEDLWGEWS